LLENAADTIQVIPNSWSADGRLVFARQEQTNWDIGVLQLDGNRAVAPMLASPAFNEGWGSVSPDGRWVAYQSNESGRLEIYVRPFPNVEAGKWQVSSSGGTIPRWSANGRTLFFVSADSVMASTILTVPTFAPATPERVLSREVFTGGYNVSGDGQRFLMLKDVDAAGAAAPPELDVILNWAEELKRLVPAN
jgi:serine/threonine-protein kinase